MRYKVTFLIGFGAGYTLGAKAGRERYEQIRRVSRGLSENPAVQSRNYQPREIYQTIENTSYHKKNSCLPYIAPSQMLPIKYWER